MGNWRLFVASVFFTFVVFAGALALPYNEDSITSASYPLSGSILTVDTICNSAFGATPLANTLLVSNNSEAIYKKPHLLATREINPRPIERNNDGEWFFLIALLGFATISVALLFFPYYARQFYRSILDTIKFSRLKREIFFDNQTPKWLLAINYFLAISLLLARGMEEAKVEILHFPDSFVLRFVVVFVTAIGVFIIKRSVEWFFSWVFSSTQSFQTHFDITVFYSNLTGLVLLPLVVVNFYSPDLIGIFVPLGILAFLFFIKTSRRSIAWFRYSNLPVIYIILYLCAVELAPLLLVAKVASSFL